MRTFGNVFQTLCLSLLVPLLHAAAVPDNAAAPSYASKRYMIEYRDGVNKYEHTQWVRSVHKRNLAKRGEGAAGTKGVETVLRQLNGYIGEFDDLTIEEIRGHADVVSVEEDQSFELFQVPSSSNSARDLVTQSDAIWGLARISHKEPGATDYVYDASAGEGHHAYILDSGINVNHVDFGGRAILGFNAMGTPEEHIDDTGHGTHVAGTVGSTTYGVAKACTLVSVKISNSTHWLYSNMLNGMDWALNDMITNNRTGQSVVNISGGGPYSGSVNNAVLAAYRKGMTLVAASGNGNRTVFDMSPASGTGVIAVGSIGRDLKRAGLSNWGAGVTVFAPGEDTLSTWIGSNTATHVTNGTSMAAPAVAGMVLYLQKLEGLTTPDAVKERIIELSVKDVVLDPQNTPNRLLYNGAA